MTDLSPLNPRRPFLRFALVALFVVSFFQAVLMRTGGRVHNNDFKHLWAGSLILAEGGDPYDPAMMLAAARQYELGAINPFVYLPSTGLLMRPFAAFDFPAAENLWFGLNFLLAWACVVWGPIAMQVKNVRLAQVAGAAFLVGSLPFMRQMTAGQMNVVMLAALIATAGLMIRREDIAAGVVLGLAAAYKITPLFLIVVLFAMRRGRAAGSAVATFFIVSMVAALWAGFGSYIDALPVLGQMGYGRSTWSEFGNEFYRDPFNQSFNSLFHHLLTKNPHTTPLLDLGPRAANVATWAVSIVLLIGLGRAMSRYRRRPNYSEVWGEPETGLFWLAALIMLMLPSLMWDHYMVQALGALVWLVGSTNFTRNPLAAGWTIVLFFLMAYPWRHANPAWSSGPAIALMSLRLWGMIALFALVYALWREKLIARRGSFG